MALASQQHGVCGPGQSQGAANRPSPVEDDLEILSRLAIADPGLDLTGDLNRILVDRIVGGDDEEIRALSGRPSHSGPVVIGPTAGAENNQ